jgi:hypothetical protein
MTTTSTTPLTPSQQEGISFSHVQLYVDTLEDLHVYKQLEHKLNEFFRKRNENVQSISIQEQQELWTQVSKLTTEDDFLFVPYQRDVVKQLLAGPGFRITATRYASDTRSVLVTSKDAQGVQILVTALEPAATSEDDEKRIDGQVAKAFDKGKIGDLQV